MRLPVSTKKLVLTLLFFTCFRFVHAQHYVFFLHNKFIEENFLNDSHPEYGKAEYFQIVSAFKRRGLTVISEIRPRNTDVHDYAAKVAGQIDSLLQNGAKASHITVIGTSKGGYIAQYTSSLLKNPEVNYVFIGSCDEEDVAKKPDINFSGNILSIYEKSDTPHSCQNMKTKSENAVGRFEEIELNTGLKHGFLFKAMPEWIDPASKWAKGNYDIHAHRRTVLAKKVDGPAAMENLLSAETKTPFNGIVYVSENGINKFSKVYGRPDIDKQAPFKFDDQFVIGSISKQFTAVLLLKEYERGHVKLHVPIKNYLPDLTESWADTVTVHHLLTHMHGIIALDKPLSFQPGTQYAYSQIGYDLLAKITEKTSGKSFALQSKLLFKKCKMYNTFHPGIKGYQNLVSGYTEKKNGKVEPEDGTFENYVAAGSFISTARDLVLWNKSLHEGKLLSGPIYKLMTTKQKGAVRNHPLFGVVDYGYGITVDTNDGILQLGQTGYSPGFVSMNFYFPETKTSIIALENVVWDEDNLKRTFRFHSELLNITRNSKLVKRRK